MPFTRNPRDGKAIYYEDDGGDGPVVLFYYGFMDPIPAARALRLAAALKTKYRLVFADHRGQGLSDKPKEVHSYELSLRVADVLAILDAMGLEQVHFVGVSWGARLGFAVGEQTASRLASLTLIANQPYAWDTRWPMVSALSKGIAAAHEGGMPAILAWFEAYVGESLKEPARTWLLENDFDAIEAAWTAAMREGSISTDLTKWNIPTLIVAGEHDDLHESARQAAGEIPGARFISLAGLDHLSSIEEVEGVLPEMLLMLQQASKPRVP